MKFIREARLRIRLRNGDFTGYVGTVTISGLRVAFSITKSLAWSTNTASIKIWGLSQNKRNLIKDYGDEVTLYAGYQRGQQTQVLFIGDTTAVRHIFDPPEIVSVLECADGDKFINQLRVSLSFAPNSSARNIIQEIASQMGINLVEFAASDDLVYREGFSYIGMGKDALTNVCDKLSLQWSVQNNGLQVIPLKGTIAEAPVEINENTGMQGVPERFTYRRIDLYRSIYAPNTGYKVNVQLNPLILPGSRVILKSTHLSFKGPYRVENARHEGDTFGSTWSTNLEVTELAR